ncbi:hypothetical protein G17_00168 [Escherichia phage vB_EcoM_G17]|nr:hypothetical protein G17_00168 [Escherichia phage vB_EcoM_G17]
MILPSNSLYSLPSNSIFLFLLDAVI